MQVSKWGNSLAIRAGGGARATWLQLTQSRNLYHAPANGRNHGLPL